MKGIVLTPNNHKHPWDLLWTNASPSSAFAEQQIDIPQGYAHYVVEMTAYAGYDRTLFQIISNANISALISVGAGGAQDAAISFIRYVGWIQGKLIMYNGSANNALNNNINVPLKIYGIK